MLLPGTTVAPSRLRERLPQNWALREDQERTYILHENRVVGWAIAAIPLEALVALICKTADG